MTTACQVVDIARKELSTTEDPPNSNRTKYGAWYGLNGERWCAIFVAWVFAQAAMDLRKLLGPGIEYTPTLAALGRKLGLEVPRDQVRAGDITLLRFSGRNRIHHVGICAEDGVKPGGLVVTIEGNTSAGVVGSQDNGGCVAQRVRPINSIACVLRPPFDACSTPTAPPPVFTEPQKVDLAAIAAALTRAKATTIEIGSNGEAVKWLQIGLNRGGQILREDGQFGRQTRAAVLAFQRAHGLAPDGVVGPATWAAIWPG